MAKPYRISGYGTAGKLRERITVFSITLTDDGEGGQTGTPTEVETLPAEIVPLYATEGIHSRAIQSDVLYRFRVRRRIDLTQKMQVKWTPIWPPDAPEETLEITGLIFEDAQFMILDCTRAATSVN